MTDKRFKRPKSSLCIDAILASFAQSLWKFLLQMQWPGLQLMNRCVESYCIVQTIPLFVGQQDSSVLEGVHNAVPSCQADTGGSYCEAPTQPFWALLVIPSRIVVRFGVTNATLAKSLEGSLQFPQLTLLLCRWGVFLISCNVHWSCIGMLIWSADSHLYGMLKQKTYSEHIEPWRLGSPARNYCFYNMIYM